VRAEPVRAEPVRAEPRRFEPIRVEGSPAQAPRPEPDRGADAWADRGEAARADSFQAEPALTTGPAHTLPAAPTLPAPRPASGVSAVQVNGARPAAAVSDGSQTAGVAASEEECDHEGMADNFMSAGTNGGDDELPSPYGTGPMNQAADHPDPRYDTRQPQAPDHQDGLARSPYGGEPATTAPPAAEYGARPEQPSGPPRPIWYQPDADQRPVTPGYPVQPQRPAGPDPRYQQQADPAPAPAAQQPVHEPPRQPVHEPPRQPAHEPPRQPAHEPPRQPVHEPPRQPVQEPPRQPAPEPAPHPDQPAQPGPVPLTDAAWQARQTEGWQGTPAQPETPQQAFEPAEGVAPAETFEPARASSLPEAPRFADDSTAAHREQPQFAVPDDVSETRLSDALSVRTERAHDSESRLTDALHHGAAKPEPTASDDPGISESGAIADRPADSASVLNAPAAGEPDRITDTTAAGGPDGITDATFSSGPDGITDSTSAGGRDTISEGTPSPEEIADKGPLSALDGSSTQPAENRPDGTQPTAIQSAESQAAESQAAESQAAESQAAESQAAESQVVETLSSDATVLDSPADASATDGSPAGPATAGELAREAANANSGLVGPAPALAAGALAGAALAAGSHEVSAAGTPDAEAAAPSTDATSTDAEAEPVAPNYSAPNYSEPGEAQSAETGPAGSQLGGPESGAPADVQAGQLQTPGVGSPAGGAPASPRSGDGAPATKKRRRIRIHHLREMKDRGEKWSMLTAYDQYTAEIFDEAGIEVLLVGDSAANNVYGYESTLRISVEEMLALAAGVARAVSHTLVVADLPFGSYQASAEQAFHTAVRFMKEAGVHAVKLEGGRTVVPQVAKLVEAGIPVMGHVGFTPQSEHGLGGYRVQGRGDSAAGLIEDAVALAEAGAFAIVLEMVPGDVAAEITKRVPVPTVGIGAGRDCDAQVLVWQDMAGLRSGPMPRFVKRYADLRSVLTDAATAFAADVANGSFPGDEHTF